MSYIWPLALVVVSNIIYQICTKAVPEGMHPLVYSIAYQATYLFPEAILTLIVISLPPVTKAFAQIKRQAVEA